MIGILIIGEETHRRKICEDNLIGRTTCDDRGGDWNGGAISQGMPRPPLEGSILPRVSKGPWSCQHLGFRTSSPQNHEEGT